MSNIVNQGIGACVVCYNENKELQGDHPAHGMCDPCIAQIIAQNPRKCPICRKIIVSVNGIAVELLGGLPAVPQPAVHQVIPAPQPPAAALQRRLMLHI